MDDALPGALLVAPPKTIVDAASYALVHTAAAMATGLMIERIVPGLSDDEQPSEMLLRAAAQVLANGVMVFGASKVLDSSQDPTGGILFTWGLIISQPTLTHRLQTLSAHLVDAASQHFSSLQTAARAEGSASTPAPR